MAIDDFAEEWALYRKNNGEWDYGGRFFGAVTGLSAAEGSDGRLTGGARLYVSPGELFPVNGDIIRHVSTGDAYLAGRELSRTPGIATTDTHVLSLSLSRGFDL